MTRRSIALFFPMRLALIALLATFATLAFSCGGSEGPSGEQVLRMRIAGDPSTLDPQLASFAEEISVVKQLFRGLFTYDEDLNVVPSVAAELPTKENGGISDDGLTYTIELRDDATWSDGTAVTANDFVYAFRRLFDPDAGAQGYYFGFYTAIAGAGAASVGEGATDAIGVSASDDSTLVIQLERPQPTLTTLLALWPASPLREDAIEQHGRAWTDPGNLIGNGPFVLAEYSPDDRIVLEANPAYWGDDRPEIERLVYRIIPDDSAAILAYENGEIDVTPVSARYDDQDLRSFDQLETYALFYNHARPPFDNVLVRRAISRAIDREAYVRVVQGGSGAPAVAWLPPSIPGVAAGVGQDLDFDATEAQRLLAEAGYADGAGLPKMTLTIVNEETNRLTADFIKGQLKEHLGIDLEVEALAEGPWVERYQSGDFQLTWLSWFADYADPENWLPEQFGSQGGANVYGYANPQLDALLEQAATELDQEERAALYNQAHAILIEDQAMTPVFHPVRNYLARNDIACLIVTPLDAQPGDWFVTSVRIEPREDGEPPASC